MKNVGRAVTVGVFAVLAGGLTAHALSGSSIDLDHLGQSRYAVEIDGRMVALPLPARHPERLAPAVTTAATGEYAFESMGTTGPILHDPCLPIHWQLSTAAMPAGAEPLAQAAVASVAEHTGLVFVFDGYTEEQASFEGPILTRGDDWEYAPMVIGWGSATQAPELGGDTTGVGGARVTPGAYTDTEFLRSGIVIIDTSDMPEAIEAYEDKARTTAVLLHELGHVVGLGHVEDRGEIMFPSTVGARFWGPGDIEGLAAAGAGQCEVA